ncbi:hypothetical protein DNHGIG_34450 [Collibacillus ludicampi]|uniref:ATP-grasp domain-containing protein n=1 Tax=Collibacillus ludicampi TaxID=2771369 RepID=A0AAV4LJF2_9BACL|nr:YheC/YheD family protein [Collibacillus ludicampi]GIM47896.1 hypothetical protein DNHGIG_34450 [Collibacillus ludicampi]
MGVLLGILTVKRGDEFRGNRRNFYDITKIGRLLGHEVIVLAPESLSIHSQTIQAWKWNHGWKLVTSRLPDVVYNRIPDRKAEQTTAVKEAKKRLKRMGIPYYNPGFFNKRSLYELLSRRADTSIFVPRTLPVSDLRDLLPFLAEVKSVYLKPIHGKAGDGIFRIDHQGEMYHIVFQKKGYRLTHRLKQEASLLKFLHKKMGRNDYVAQEGIDLSRVQGRMFDLRLLLQKGREGHFEITGFGCRVAAPDGITTHVPNGGMILPAVESLAQVFPGQEEQVMNRVTEMAMRCAETIDEGEEELVGEMSMDIGVDRESRLWFFEANAKPMKFDEPHIRERSLKQIFYFCEHLLSKASRI